MIKILYSALNKTVENTSNKILRRQTVWLMWCRGRTFSALSSKECFGSLSHLYLLSDQRTIQPCFLPKPPYQTISLFLTTSTLESSLDVHNRAHSGYMGWMGFQPQCECWSRHIEAPWGICREIFTKPGISVWGETAPHVPYPEPDFLIAHPPKFTSSMCQSMGLNHITEVLIAKQWFLNENLGLLLPVVPQW